MLWFSSTVLPAPSPYQNDKTYLLKMPLTCKSSLPTMKCQPVKHRGQLWIFVDVSVEVVDGDVLQIALHNPSPLTHMFHAHHSSPVVQFRPDIPKYRQNNAMLHTPFPRPWACKGKERKSIYIPPFCTKVHTKRSGMDHRVFPANNTMPAFPSWAFTRWHHHNNWGSRHPIAAHYIYRPRKDERLSWPGWLTYSGWLTHISGHPSATGRAQDSESTPTK